MMIIGISLSLGSVAIPLITEKFVQERFESGLLHLVADNLQFSLFSLYQQLLVQSLLAGPLYTVFYGRSEANRYYLVHLESFDDSYLWALFCH